LISKVALDEQVDFVQMIWSSGLKKTLEGRDLAEWVKYRTVIFLHHLQGFAFHL
jgi:hypothetical protein